MREFIEWLDDGAPEWAQAITMTLLGLLCVFWLIAFVLMFLHNALWSIGVFGLPALAFYAVLQEFNRR